MLGYERTEEHITQNWRNMESLVYACINSQKGEISLLQSARSNLFFSLSKIYLYKKFLTLGGWSSRYPQIITVTKWKPETFHLILFYLSIISAGQVCICFFIDSLKYFLHLAQDIWRTCLGIVLIVLKALSHLLPQKDTTFSVIVTTCFLSFYLQKLLTVLVNLALPTIYLFERCQPASIVQFQSKLHLSFLWC